MDDYDDVVIIYSCLLTLVEEMGGLVKVSKNSILDIAQNKNKHIGLFIDDEDQVILEVIDNDKN